MLEFDMLNSNYSAFYHHVMCYLRNALSSQMMGQLGDAVVAAYKTPDTKALIIKAQGKVFSAGHDLRELVSWCPCYNLTSYKQLLLGQIVV